MTASWRTWVLYGAAALILIALVRRDWAHQRSVHDRISLGQNHASIDIGLRDYHEHGPYDDRVEPLHGLFIIGTRIEAPGRAMFALGLLALVACAAASERFRRGKPGWVARVLFALPQAAALVALIVFWRRLEEPNLVAALDVGGSPLVMLAGLTTAAAAMVWPRSSRSRSPEESLPPARARARSPAPADVGPAPRAPRA